MELRVHGTADEFLEAAGEALLRDEARHNAVLGVAHRVRDGRRYGPEPPYFVTVHEGNTVLVAALRTPPHPLLLAVLAPRPGAVERLADHLVAADPALPGVNGLLPHAADFAWRWVARRGVRAEEEMRLRLYALREVIPPVGVPGELREPRAEERDLLASWIRAFQAEALPHEPPEDPHQVLGRFTGPHAWLRVWDRGGPVSMAAAFRVSPHGARIVLVYTPPERRRHGYASACVAALSRLLLDQGCSFCALYADLANPASNRVYQRIGYRPLGDAALYRFTAAERNRSPSSRNARRASASR
ncbi:MAG: GNAT family N-acetyltransferase [Candidatus Bipolaricaulota bacterium]|nr:GNAT family N-acetyltransferase [Candidatus Bipolaricaulota bacterium]